MAYLNPHPHPTKYTHDETAAYAAYQNRFPVNAMTLLQTALETEQLREAQVLEGSRWLPPSQYIPESEPAHSGTTALGALVGVFRKSFEAARKRPVQALSSASPSPMISSTSVSASYESTPHHDYDDDAYGFYTDTSQSRLMETALNTEHLRDAQFSEGSVWTATEMPSPDLRAYEPQADTAVLGALVSLFGRFSRR